MSSRSIQQYIGYNQRNDQFCGRTLSGLPLNDCLKFSSLPPHYHDEDFIVPVSDWEQFLDGYHMLEDGFKSTLPFFLATLMFHKEYLELNLGNSHPLRRSQVWGSKYMQDMNYRNKITIHSNLCNHCMMKVTGIPLQWSSNDVIQQLFDKVNYLNNHFLGNKHYLIFEKLFFI